MPLKLFVVVSNTSNIMSCLIRCSHFKLFPICHRTSSDAYFSYFRMIEMIGFLLCDPKLLTKSTLTTVSSSVMPALSDRPTSIVRDLVEVERNSRIDDGESQANEIKMKIAEHGGWSRGSCSICETFYCYLWWLYL